MKTFNRICIEEYVIHEGDAVLHLERGKEYTTSAEIDGDVKVFSNYWAWVPVSIFAGEIRFT